MLSLEADIRSIGMSQDQIFPLRNEAAGIGLAVPEIIRFVNGPALTTSEPSALTIQATGAWSQKHLYEDPQLVIARLCAIWEEISGQPLPPFLMLARIAGFMPRS